MEIDGRKIGPEYPPYIIAEMSNNHLGSLDRAKKIIAAAKQAGADAVKIQTYDANALTIDVCGPDFVLNNPLWKGKTYYQLYQEIGLPMEYTRDLFACAGDIGITLFSSPFDQKSIDLLMDLGCPAFKIASFEAVDPSFVASVARTKKPILMSTGVCDAASLGLGMETLAQHNVDEVLLMHCISAYPAGVESSNLKVLERLKKYSRFVGLSDHCLDPLTAVGAVALGGCAVEKHVTLSRQDGGPDAAFSIEPRELEQLKHNCIKIWESLGSADILEQEDRPGREHARSLYIVQDVSRGETATRQNVRSIRPGFGLAPRHVDQVMGKRFNRALGAGTALKWEYLW